MSTFVPVLVTCPGCGHVQEETLATSLNVTRTPHWKDAVLDGSFQQVRCSSCGATWEAVEPFIYLDFKLRLYVGVHPAGDEAVWWEHENGPADAFVRNLGWAAPPVARPIGEGFAVRTTFGLASLREKIVARDAGLDDVTLEALKLRLLLTRHDLRFGLAARLRLTSVDGPTLVFASSGVAIRSDRAAYDEVGDDPVLAAQLYPLLAGHPYCDLGRLLVPEPSPV
jgi:ribosomal protein S27E